MSENISSQEEFKIQFQLQASFSSSPLQYVFQQRAASPCLLVRLTNKLLLKWRDLTRNIGNTSYLELFQATAITSHLPFEMKPGAERINERLRTLASEAYTKGKGLRGLSRVNFLMRERVLQVFQQELTDVSSLRARLEECEVENKDLKMQVEELDSRCEKLVQDLMEEKCRLEELEDEFENRLEENQNWKYALIAVKN